MIETDNKTLEIVKNQCDSMDVLKKMIEKQHKCNKSLLAEGNKVLKYYNDRKHEFVEDFNDFMNSMRNARECSEEEIISNVSKFWKCYKHLFRKYDDMKSRMKDGQCIAVEHDQVMSAINRCEDKFEEFQARFVRIQSSVRLSIPPILSLTPKFRTDRIIHKSLHININKGHYKPVESEIITNISRVRRELILLKTTWNTRQFVNVFTEKIIKQGCLVCKLLNEEFAPRSIDDYIDTLVKTSSSTITE